MSDLRTSVGAVLLPRDVVRISGPDAVSFLQGQCSQDVAGLAVGESAHAFVLQPQGKVDVWGRVTRVADDALILDLDAGWGDAAVARLNRFKLRVKAEIEVLPWSCVALRGAGWEEVPLPAVPVVARVDWPGMQGVDLLGPDVTVPTGVPVVERAVYELLRIEAGIPAMGAELDDHTIPAEAGVVERSVSFTKGCYTGQELVARVDSRGSNTPRRLRGVVVAGAVPPQGAELVLDDRVVGVLTSVEPSPEGALALAYVRREVEPPAELRVRTPAGDLPVHVAALPLVVD
ncbi:MAG: hypothetical protein MUE34_04270 [Acidimicrobiales bacterium]|nr:hypothetical protein [Acidimicrobiales bacterium]